MKEIKVVVLLIPMTALPPSQPGRHFPQRERGDGLRHARAGACLPGRLPLDQEEARSRPVRIIRNGRVFFFC